LRGATQENGKIKGGSNARDLGRRFRLSHAQNHLNNQSHAWTPLCLNTPMPEQRPEIVLVGDDESADLTLLDLIDHVLNTGVIIRGNLVLSLAGVDLVYLGLDLIVSSVETALRHMAKSSLPPADAGRRSKR
jgi:hypothetical protein